MIGLAVPASLALVALVATPASATRARFGVFHAQLTTHLSNASTSSSGTVAGSGDVMAIVVGLLALVALVFMIVTFIRRQPRDT